MSARRRSPDAERIDRIKGNMRMDRNPKTTRISGNLINI